MTEAERSDGSLQQTRRQILSCLTVAGIGTATFRRALADEVAVTGRLTEDDVARAEWIADLTLTPDQRLTTSRALQGVLENLRKIRSVPVSVQQWPAFRFDPEAVIPTAERIGHQPPDWLQVASVDPVTAWNAPTVRHDGNVSRATAPVKDHGELTTSAVATASIRQLAAWLRSGQLTSRQLTQQSLDRLKQYDPVLNCVVTLTEPLAMEQAEQADRELSAGMDRGPLHGIPWGAKDLISVPGYPTTWGAPQYLEQYLDSSAHVYTRLCNAGAVLVAKLSLGALAMGDRWFGGQTRNPWNPQQGSSGSSAGSAAAVAAGLVPFALGSETLGSIISPTRRCGITSLRPTFGRVSRAGCMPLSWTMDKIGPMARTVDDCGWILRAIHGADDQDPSSVQRWFDWPAQVDLSALQIGHVQNRDTTPAEESLIQRLQNLGARLVPVELPDGFPEWALAMMLDVEAATIFHGLLASGDTNGLNAWPEIFRKSHFVSAIDFLHAARVRCLLMQRMAEVFQRCHMYVGGGDLGITNLTGHPTIALPIGMTSGNFPQPECVTMTGRLYDEATLLAVAALVQPDDGLPSRVAPAFLR